MLMLTRSDHWIAGIVHHDNVGNDLAAKGEITVGAADRVDEKEQCQ